ncbi:TolC family protein [Oscillatoria sp. HE19RPO]|uniref:TolC family protein n=1 Tax=Oscillatoria sp. HE19RPO TaxID=2954806 RepID=UPI002810DBAD|nr:TolC family protein [Oscillatoria sp. HE19RPO]
MRKNAPQIDVPPPAEPVEPIVIERPEREAKAELPLGDRLEQNEVISQSLPQLPEESNPPNGDRSLESRVEQARVSLLPDQNTRDDRRDNLLIQVGDRVRNARLLLEQVNLAQQEREFIQKTLENERELLRLGRGEIHDVISVQEAVVSANNSELNAQIAYLHALTLLQQTVGITLETWQITVETLGE